MLDLYTNMRCLDEEIEVLRNMSEHLIPYNFPKGPPQNEDIIAPLKRAMVDVDGYTVGLHFNKADYGTYFLETVQVFGATMPFLPFHLVVKIARRILGSHFLSFIEVPKEDRKYYCWTCCTDRQGKPIRPQYDVKTEDAKFEGFSFTYIHASQFNFY